MRKTVIQITLMLFCVLGYTQEGIHQGQFIKSIPENFLSTSPDVAAFQKFNTIPVSLYTGKIDLSIPIFNITSGNISIPISVSYNSGGIKVDDIASSVGVGWNLNAGGSIIRLIKDLPDNNVGFSLHAENDWDLGLILNPILTSYGFNRKYAKPIQNFYIWSPTNRHKSYKDNPDYPAYSSEPVIGNIKGFAYYNSARKDLSPDIFFANAPGLNTKFTSINNTENAIYPSNSENFTNTFLDGSGCKMESIVVDKRSINGTGFFSSPSAGDHYGRIYDPIKDFFEFTIVDTKGLKYLFKDEEIRENYYSPANLQEGGNGISGFLNATETMITNNYSKNIHTWNLTSITDQKTNKIVTFNYDTYSNNNTELSRNGEPLGINLGGTYHPNLCKFGFNTSVTAYSCSGYTNNVEKQIKRKRISKIRFDKGEVFFLYDLERQDYIGEKALTEIQIKDLNGNIIKKVKFNYSYLISKENCSTPECKRLKLERVDFYGKGTSYNSYILEYDTVNPLPKRGSLEQDYLGYYNNNGFIGLSESKPTVYFYDNQGVSSLLPFPRSNVGGKTLQGDFSMIPNNYSLSGLLKKITYPTGGQSEFVYENNTFNFKGASYISGGARIKSQIVKSDGEVVKKIDYKYEEADGKTSGYINNIPVFGFITEYNLETSTPVFEVYNKPKNGIELTSSSFVGYSRVLEIEQNNGYTEYIYSSNKENPNVNEVRTSLPSSSFRPLNNSNCTTKLINNSAYPYILYKDYDFKRGKLIKKKIYDSSNTLKKSEEKTYLTRVNSSLPIDNNFKIPTIWEDYNYEFNIKSSIDVAQDLNIKTIINEYLGKGNISTIKEKTYDPEYPIVKEDKTQTNNKVILSKYYYPHDEEVKSRVYMNDLRTQNRFDEIIKQEVYHNGGKVVTELVNYERFSSNSLYVPSKVQTLKGVPSTTNILEDRIIYHNYDNKGNPTEVSKADGTHIVYIWGYNQTQPIAKIENAKLSDISEATITNLQTLSNQDNDKTTGNLGKEGALRTALNTLRDIANTQVTTYTYDPLIGVTSVTDPRGQTVYYVYDDFNRLEYVKDADGNLLKEHKYKYKN